MKTHKRNPMSRGKPRYYIDGHGIASAFRTLGAAKRRAQGIANRTGSTVYVSHYDSPGGFKTGSTTVTPSRKNSSLRKGKTGRWLKAKAVKVVRKNGRLTVMVKR